MRSSKVNESSSVTVSYSVIWSLDCTPIFENHWRPPGNKVFRFCHITAKSFGSNRPGLSTIDQSHTYIDQEKSYICWPPLIRHTSACMAMVMAMRACLAMRACNADTDRLRCIRTVISSRASARSFLQRASAASICVAGRSIGGLAVGHGLDWPGQLVFLSHVCLNGSVAQDPSGCSVKRLRVAWPVWCSVKQMQFLVAQIKHGRL
jgi:hypothetical protein